MTDRKKLRFSKRNVQEKCAEICVDSKKHVADPVSSSSSCDADKFPLSDLPNEVLLFIYAFLSPVDLAAISDLGNKRLRDLTFCIKEANFFSCWRAGAERIKAYFTRSRVKHVTELSFNYIPYIKPQVLTQLICRCKALITLSIIECGLRFHHLAQIIDTCSQLEDLTWNFDEVAENITALTKSVKNVHLICGFKVTMRSIFHVLRNFVNVKNVWINFTPDAVSVLPFIGMFLEAICVEDTVLDRRFILLTNVYQCISVASDIQYLKVIIHQLNAPNPWCIDDEPSENAEHDQTFMTPPYVQLSSDKHDILKLSEFSKAFTSVSILFTPEILGVSEDLVKSINKAAGDKLEHLSLINEARIPQGHDEPEPTLIEESRKICETLEMLSLTCQYITVLNLVTVHFSAGSPLKSIGKLKYLKTLVIPTCAFCKDIDEEEQAWLEVKDIEFKEVVSKCPLVEDFSLFCCELDFTRITDGDLYPLQEWKELKHLTICSSIFRTCSFLKKVADSCKKLQSFSLITVWKKIGCQFITDVIYLVKFAKNLRFIRINEEKFNPMYERFWNAVGEAVNLEGICIITRSKTVIPTNIILNAVRQLKYLHLFHFAAPRASERLFSEVKKSIQDHGIVNYSLENTCYINSYDIAATMQYYHQQPHFCCQRIHFRNC